jgi:hypothetical protein
LIFSSSICCSPVGGLPQIRFRAVTPGERAPPAIFLPHRSIFRWFLFCALVRFGLVFVCSHQDFSVDFLRQLAPGVDLGFVDFPSRVGDRARIRFAAAKELTFPCSDFPRPRVFFRCRTPLSLGWFRFRASPGPVLISPLLLLFGFCGSRAERPARFLAQVLALASAVRVWVSCSCFCFCSDMC